jgi:hypothetical protein
MNIHAYKNTVTDEYPLFEGDIRLRCPNIGIVFECPEGYEPVYNTELPDSPSKDWYRRELPPERINGIFYRRFELCELCEAPKRIASIGPTKIPLQSGKGIFGSTPATGHIEVNTFGFSK